MISQEVLPPKSPSWHGFVVAAFEATLQPKHRLSAPAELAMPGPSWTAILTANASILSADVPYLYYNTYYIIV